MADTVDRTYTRREYWQAVVLSGVVGIALGAFAAGGFLSSFLSGS